MLRSLSSSWVGAWFCVLLLFGASQAPCWPEIEGASHEGSRDLSSRRDNTFKYLQSSGIQSILWEPMKNLFTSLLLLTPSWPGLPENGMWVGFTSNSSMDQVGLTRIWITIVGLKLNIYVATCSPRFNGSAGWYKMVGICLGSWGVPPSRGPPEPLIH